MPYESSSDDPKNSMVSLVVWRAHYAVLFKEWKATNSAGNYVASHSEHEKDIVSLRDLRH